MKIIDKLYLIYFKRKNAILKNVKFAHHACIDVQDIFEGNNYIGGVFKNSYIGYGSYVKKGDIYGCKIGRFCSIARGCNIGLAEHPIFMPSTSPCFYQVNSSIPKTFVKKNLFEEESRDRYKVYIGNDVWIGAEVSIKNGVKVGDGAVIGTKSFVTKDVPPYAVVAGIPARIIKYRFEKEVIEKLLRLKWWDREVSWIEKNAEIFGNKMDLFLQSLEEK